MGMRQYAETLEEMQAFTAARTHSTEDEIWLLQHYPVFTQGQAGKPEHLLHAGVIPVVQSDRGGQITYHGPGQLIIYLLIDIRRRKIGVRQLVDLIEQTIISLLDEYAIESRARKDAPGVYVGASKIAALGLRIRKGCSYHGLSLNVDMDLLPFNQINPCGMQGLGVTQMKSLCIDAELEAIGERLACKLIEQL
ncbi:MAG: lipoyl(octanoyl) transferase LipB [Pseudomonadales bacterium]|nr:lipoyl(octanoyl) transferase LipB [Pseudomonadales bacterium]